MAKQSVACTLPKHLGIEKDPRAQIAHLLEAANEVEQWVNLLR